MGSCMQVGGVWAGSPLKMMVDSLSGRPTPTARSWKPAHVTTWLASCSSTQRGNGPGTGVGRGTAGLLPMEEGVLDPQRSLAPLPGVSRGI